MLSYVMLRVLQAALTLLLVALVTFLLMHAVPGGPFESRSSDLGITQEFVAAQEAYYGLDDPLAAQFVRLLGNLAHGDLGISFAQRGQRVTDLLLDRVAISLLLGGAAFAMVLAFGLPLGVAGAIWARRAWDHLGLALTTVLGAVPSFVLAFLLLLVFAVWLDVVDVRVGRDFGEGLGSLPNGLLPAFALAAPALALLARITRASLLEALSADYVRTARAKGLGRGAVYLRHALRNALIPVLTVLGPLLANLIAGSVVIETIFGMPGLGSAYVTSITQRDYGVIMGVTLFYAALVLAANLAVDLAYPLVDPRVRLAR
ncbi:MAG: ABC transporter permease [Chloroflexi bacterium]|nr:ABC transporter permease [Chloroflexota bacterium]